MRITKLVTGDGYMGDDTIKAAIVAHIGSDAEDMAAAGLAIGETVYYNRLMCPLNETPGVVDYSLEISTDGSSWKRENIPISARQKAVTSADKVEVSK